LVVLPGWIIYGVGQRKYKKATTPPKIKGDLAYDVKVGLLIFTIVIGFIMTIVGIIVLHFPVIILGLILTFGPMAGLAAMGNGNIGHYNARDAFYMNRWGSHQAKKNMRRAHRWSKK
jgi:uncharacterized membrane protein